MSILDENTNDLTSFLLLPLLYSYQLNDSLKRRVMKHLESIKLSKEEIEKFSLEWETISSTLYSNSKSDLLSEIALSNLETLLPEINEEVEKYTLFEAPEKRVATGMEESINEFCYKRELTIKSEILTSLKCLNENLTKKCCEIEERVLNEHKAIATLYETIKQDMN